MRRSCRDRGAVLVEMAFVAPILVLFLIGSLQVGLVVIGNTTASNAAREGARAASIRYECADNHISARCPVSPSTNYTYIRDAVMDKLAGLVKEASVTVTVQCRAQSSTGPVVTCERGFVDPDADVVVVSLGWRHIGATPYIADNVHTSTARAVIIGRPDLTLLSPEPDAIPPTLLSQFIYDTNADGVLDQIKLTFSEDIEQNVVKNRFVITNSVTGSSEIASASVLNRVVTINLNAGSTVNTAPGAMRIALNAASDGIRDLWGNQASFGPTEMTDMAKPVLTGLADSNIVVAGYPTILDTLTLSFSEPIATAIAATTVTYADPLGGGNDTVSISGITAGPLTTNSNNYNNTNDSTVSFTGTVTKSGNTVVVTVSNPFTCVPIGCLRVGVVTGESAWTFTPATTLADANNNTATGTRTISNLF